MISAHPAPQKATEPVDPFEPAFREAMAWVVQQRIPFNIVLGVRIVSLAPDAPRLRFDMKPELVGNFDTGQLHGGVIAAVLDVMAGYALMLRIAMKHLDDPVRQRMMRFAKLGTIDLRIDYLRPAKGAWFDATGSVMRLGSRVGSTRMELCDDQGHLVATGNASFIVS